MDFTDLTDDDLDALRIAVLTEQERRRTIATATEQALAAVPPPVGTNLAAVTDAQLVAALAKLKIITTD